MTDSQDYSGEHADYVHVADPEPETGDDVLGVDGELVIAIPAAKYGAGKTATAQDTALVAGNIKDAVSVFGVTGTLAGGMSALTASYPPAHDDTYVKATSKFNTNTWPYYATDPTKSLIDAYSTNSWLSGTSVFTNRFHIDLGSAKKLGLILYHPYHSNGTDATVGFKDFTVWGSNAAADFADLTYANDGTWVQLTTESTQAQKHITENVSNPHYIYVQNDTAYRYYCLKIANNWGEPFNVGIRRITCMTFV
ncbi:MAG: hypothetical protein KJ954_14325 [Alphaproteobacteria bacterium]|nr:hypothetical protein [Alphaproteobacteria bacterium]